MEHALPRRTASAPRTWSLCMTSENHGTVGPAGCTFSHAPEKHERVQVVEIVAAGSPPAPGVDLSGLMRFDFVDLGGEDEQFVAVDVGGYLLAHEVEARVSTSAPARPVAEFKGYIDGQPAVTWLDRENMPRVGTKLFTQAAANKAAEEGMTPTQLASVIDSMGWDLDDVEKADMYVLCCAAIAADRASRQVANKAEVEPIGYMRFRAAQSYDGRGDIDHNEWFEQCAPDELGDDKLPAFPVYATPPATTGASTAPVKTFIELRNRIAELEKQIREQSVGASTVLTDESRNGIPATHRHDEGAIARCSYCRRYSLDPATLSDRQPVCECGKQHGWSGSFKKPEPDSRWSGKAPVPLEVAAQAGQVAPAEELARFCPACGSVGDVTPAYRDCCPDGNEARRIPKPLANKCSELFKVALAAMRARAPASPTVAQQAPAQAAPLPASQEAPKEPAKECWSIDEEENFSHDSLSELLANYPDLKAGAKAFFGEAIYPALSRLIDSDDVVDLIADRAYDIAGDHADGYPGVSAEKRAELDALLSAWISKSCPPAFYEVKNVRCHTITAHDIAAMQASTPGESQEGGAA